MPAPLAVALTGAAAAAESASPAAAGLFRAAAGLADPGPGNPAALPPVSQPAPISPPVLWGLVAAALGAGLVLGLAVRSRHDRSP